MISELKFEIFHLANNNNSKGISIQELIDDNLKLPSEVLKMRCSQCSTGEDQDAETMRSISKLPLVLLINVPKFEFIKSKNRVIKVPTKQFVLESKKAKQQETIKKPCPKPTKKSGRSSRRNVDLEQVIINTEAVEDSPMVDEDFEAPDYLFIVT